MNKKHPTRITGYPLEELAEKVGDLRYDKLQEFLEFLSAKILKDAEADRLRQRLKLSKNLQSLGENIQTASLHAKEAWKICQPYELKQADNEQMQICQEEFETVMGTSQFEDMDELDFVEIIMRVETRLNIAIDDSKDLCQFESKEEMFNWFLSFF